MENQVTITVHSDNRKAFTAAFHKVNSMGMELVKEDRKKGPMELLHFTLSFKEHKTLFFFGIYYNFFNGMIREDLLKVEELMSEA